jgi:Recombination endonuclease VII
MVELSRLHPEKHRARNKRSRERHYAAFRLKDEERYSRMKTRIRVRQLNKRGAKLDEDFVEKVLSATTHCEICGKEFIERVSPHIDHDHVTGAFRGVLCRQCNQALGLFKDDPDRLLRAACYLERNLKTVSSDEPRTLAESEGKTIEVLYH